MNSIALLIDLENISPQIIDQVFETLTPLGTIKIKRAYGDFSKSSSQLLKWKSLCLTHNIEIIHHFSCKPNKNSSDILLAIDAMDILHHHHIDTFCIVSSDSDFSSLVQRLKRNQCNVIGIGSNQPNESYTLIFDDFYQISPEPLPQLQKQPEPEQTRPARSFLSNKFNRLIKFFYAKSPESIKPKAKVIGAEKPQTPSTTAPLTQEQQLIKTAYKKAKKNAEGYVMQSIFASALTVEQRNFIKNHYKTFGRFVVESPYLSIKVINNCQSQHWIKPNF